MAVAGDFHDSNKVFPPAAKARDGKHADAKPQRQARQQQAVVGDQPLAGERGADHLGHVEPGQERRAPGIATTRHRLRELHLVNRGDAATASAVPEPAT